MRNDKPEGTPRPPPVFRKLSSRRSFDDVAREIRTLIGEGMVREGDRLPAERELAAQLGVSRGTVREALRGLETAGLVEMKNGVAGGAFIRQPDSTPFTESLGDLYRFGELTAEHLTEARIILGCEVARLACARRDDADLQALAENIRRAEDALSKGDLLAKTEGSIEFHRLLARSTRNPALIMMTNALAEIMREFVQALGARPNQFALEAQARLLEHLRAREPDAAEQEMRVYLRQTHSNYLNLRQPGQ